MRDEQGVRPLDERLGLLFVVVAVAIIAIAAASVLLASVLPARGAAFDLPVLLPILLQNGFLAGFALWRLRRFGLGWLDLRPYVESFSQGAGALGWGVALLFLNAFGSQLSILIFAALAGPEAVQGLLQREQAAVARLLDPEAGSLQLAGTVFLAVGVAPVAEELFFRGYAYPVLKHHAGRHAGWLSALYFAGVHLYVVNFLPIFLLGWAFASMYERSRSLAVPIVAHATVNGLVAVIAVALGRAGP